MIEKILLQGKAAGFSTVEVFHEKKEKQEYEKFLDYNASHFVKNDNVSVRAFWEFGEPVGFNMSKPDIKSIKTGFSSVCSLNIPGTTKNYAYLLPSQAQKVKINIFDDSIKTFDIKKFDELVEKIKEILVSFPGLSLKRIKFFKILKKCYISNTNGFNAKYKKTNFNLTINFEYKNNSIEINENEIYFNRINPFRMISRAFNLLNSLTDNNIHIKKDCALIFSPEASVFLLREFSGNFCLSFEGSLKKINFPSVLSIIENPNLDYQTGSVPFDDEGVQSGEKYLVNKGVFLDRISDIKTAFYNKRACSTGNGFRSDKSIFPFPRFSNFFIKPSVLSLNKLMMDAGKGILVSLIKLKNIENNEWMFSAYGYRFENGDINEPVHFHFKTSFFPYFLNILKVSKEIKFFNINYNIGSPYLLINAKHLYESVLQI
jgi:predicted Zn-dependent protease